MDPIARAATWHIIRRAAREGRAVVLTTHHLDEADVLADRVIIMSRGRVRCAGTLAHLREHFGLGFTLSLAIAPGSTSAAAVAAVTAVLPTVKPPQSHRAELENGVEDATAATPLTLGSSAGEDVVLHISAAAASKLPALCDVLDSCSSLQSETRNSRVGGRLITSYAINSLSLGDIFMAVVAEEEVGKESEEATAPARSNRAAACTQNVFSRCLSPPQAAAPPSDMAYDEAMQELCASRPTLFAGDLPLIVRLTRHCDALVRRRLTAYQRDFKSLFIQLVVPAVAVLAGLALLLLVIPGNQPSYAPSTAAFNVQPWLHDPSALPSSVVPFLLYKADGVAASVDMVGLPALLRCVPDANLSLPDSPALGVAAASALPNDFSFFSESSAAQPPTDDLARLSTALLRYAPAHRLSVYGAVAFTNNGSALPAQATGGIDLTEGSAEATYTLLVNTTAAHSPPLFMLLADSALYGAARAGGGCTAPPASLPFAVSNHPLPLTAAQVQLNKGYNAGSAATLLMIVLSAAPAAIAHTAVRDRETGVRRAMDLAGLSPAAYWLASWIVDALTTLVTLFVCLGLFAAFQLAAFSSLVANRLQATVVLMALYCIAMPPQTYVLSFAFSSASSAQMAVFLINVGCVGLMIISMIMGQAAPMAGCDFDSAARYLYRLLPGFDLGNGMYALSFLPILPSLNANCKRFHNEDVTAADLAPIDAFAFSATGVNVIYLAAIAPLFFLLTLLLDSNGGMLASARALFVYAFSFSFCTSAGPGHGSLANASGEATINAGTSDRTPLLPKKVPAFATSTVARKPSAYDSGSGRPDNGDPEAWLEVRDVRKTYAGASAPSLDGLSLRVRPGEVLGLLGANGAGKTTLFRALTGESAPTTGAVWVVGKSVGEGGALTAGVVGFVPQVDALMDHLTVGEHLALFGRLRGVGSGSAAVLARAARAASVAVGIARFWDAPAHRLSGGTRRKLSLACALIGCPPVLLLDEFTSGCDAHSRRFLWGTLEGIRASVPCAVLVSSHHMEDLEHLCTALAVVAHGRVLAQGTPQALKDRFCAGYSLELHLSNKDGIGNCGNSGGSALSERLLSLLSGLPQLHAPVLDSAAAASAAAATLVRSLGGSSERAATISPTGTGWVVHAALVSALQAPRHGGTSTTNPDFSAIVAAIESWWYNEEGVDALVALLLAELPGAKVAERHGRVLRLSLPSLSVAAATRDDREAAHFSGSGAVFKLIDRLRRVQGANTAAPNGTGTVLPTIASFGLSQNSLDVVLERMVADADRLAGAASIV